MKITSAHRNKKGFSLIELMVVIAIIAILTAIVTSNFAQSKARARDAKRVSDIAQLQLTLALFFDRCNGYPITTGEEAVVGTMTNPSCPGGITIGNYISVIPRPPVGTPSTFYKYISNGRDYILSIDLEEKASALDDDIDDPASIVLTGGTVNVACDDASKLYCVRPN